MKILKALLRLAACEILCLFIDITFAASGSTLIKLICLVIPRIGQSAEFGTVMIMIFVLADFSVKEAKADMKASRMNGSTINKAAIFAAGGAVIVPPLISWILLCVSAKGSSFDYYPLHKLLNAPFLQFYNIINSSIHACDLSNADLTVMLVPIVFPSLAVIIPYLVTCGKETEK